MATYSFQAYPATAKATFECLSCGKDKRTRSFTVDCTVNPFNTREDGTPRTPAEVFKQSSAEASQRRDEFLRYPLCRSCEDRLPYAQHKEVVAKRRDTQSA